MNPEPQPFRCFVALPLETAVVSQLRTLQDRLRSQLRHSAIRWTAPDQIHLTLAFLGNVDPTRIQSLCSDLETACSTPPPLNFALSSLGAFPNPHRPRVLWVGLTGDLEKLANLQASVRNATASYAERPDAKPFHPHLTLARVRAETGQPPDLHPLIHSSSDLLAPCAWTSHEVHLFRSELRPQGPLYTSLAVIRLSSPNPGRAESVEAPGG